MPDLNDLFGAVCSGPTYEGSGELSFFDNAAFMPAGGLLGGFPETDMIVFAQGTQSDFAYDGDAVYHEFGHAVMKTVTPGLFTSRYLFDEYGLDPGPGGLNEGFPDYFSSAITGDAVVGEYALSPLGGSRTLDNQASCPAFLWGEMHQDSVPFTGALWEVRQGLPMGQRPAMDRAVYTAMASLGATDGFASAQAAVVAELTLLDAEVGAQAAAVFAARGLADCGARAQTLEEGGVKDALMLVGTDQVQADLVPAPLQFAIAVPEGTTGIRVEILQAQSLGALIGGDAPAASLLVKPGDEPIRWDWSDPRHPTHDAPIAVDVTAESGGGGEATGSFPTGRAHLMLANAGATVTLAGVRVSTSKEAGGGDGGVGPGADGGGGGGADDDGGGCGCRAAGGGIGGAGWLLLSAVAAVLLRRRR
jgi:MYXO-CTERM domain-containing protein